MRKARIDVGKGWSGGGVIERKGKRTGGTDEGEQTNECWWKGERGEGR